MSMGITIDGVYVARTSLAKLGADIEECEYEIRHAESMLRIYAAASPVITPESAWELNKDITEQCDILVESSARLAMLQAVQHSDRQEEN